MATVARLTRPRPAALLALLLLGVAAYVGVTASREDARDGPAGTGSGATSGTTTALVTSVVDGDTIRLANGERVRLVGIDTPEVGECGYQSATDQLSRLVLDKEVQLSVSDEDRDRYGRLLRYVDVGSIDAGLQLIESGAAVARYDSRDGHGFHPRERAYIAGDRDSENPDCP